MRKIFISSLLFFLMSCSSDSSTAKLELKTIQCLMCSAKIEESAGFEKEGEVIGLMMYLGDPPELTEHLFTSGRSKCLEMKSIAEETSFAYYECARVNAVIKGSKIVSIIEEIEVIE